MAAVWQAAVWCLLGTGGGETVLLDFYADWCGPCRAMMPLVDQLVGRGYPIRKINIEHHPELAARFGVRVVPCFVKLVNGREVAREVGPLSMARLEQLCQLGEPQGGAIFGGRNPSAGGCVSGSLGRQNTLPMSGTGGVPGPASPMTTKDGLPIPTVELGVPKAAPVPAASGAGVAEAPLAAGSAGLPSATGPGLSTGSTSSPNPPVAAGSLPTGAVTEQDLLAATVRLRVYHGNSLSHGTGTIIDARQGEALILTCGHLFRESGGRGRIEVDLFAPSPAEKLPARLIAWNDQRDLGLLSIRTPGPVRAARVGPVGYPLKKGLVVFSVGCDHGQMPTVHKTWVVSVNRYLGSPNLQVADQPVSGRSGGGLFTQEGYLIGVCNAADPADREGLFASLPAIHAQLDEVGLQFVYQQGPELPAQMPRPDPRELVQNNHPSSGAGVPLRWPGGSNPAGPSGGVASTDLAALPPAAVPSSPREPASGNRFQGGTSGPNTLAGGVGVPEGGGPGRPAADSSFPPQASAPAPLEGGPLMELAAWVRGESARTNSLSGLPGKPNRADCPTQEVASQTQPGASAANPVPTADGNLAAGQPVPGGLRGIPPLQAPGGNGSGGAESALAGGLRPEEAPGTNGPAPTPSTVEGGLRPEESALLAELARRHRQGAEIIFIVRPRDDPHANSEIYVLHEASPELLARLGVASQKTQIRETSLVVGTEGKPNGSSLPSIPGSPSPSGASASQGRP